MIPFNPFTIGPNHDDHSNSTEIIKLEESGQVFCPLCLSSSHQQIEEINGDQFEKYVRGLFEALDQHGEKRSVRGIVLSILEIILSRRDICITSDHDFHNLLRIVYKILNSDKFRHNEFSAVAQMFSAITRKFTNADTFPLISASKAAEVIVESAGNQLSKYLEVTTSNLRTNVIKLLISVYTTIRAYLELLSRFTISRSSELIFPLSNDDDPQLHCRSYHKDRQTKCLNFAYRMMFPVTIAHLKGSDRFDTLDRELLLSFFGTLRVSFMSAVRVSNTDFIDYMIRGDFLALAHTLTYKCADIDLRLAIKSFLKTYTLHFIETKFEFDQAFIRFIARDDIVETNHKNAIVYSRDPAKSCRTIFYVMVSYVANEQKSEYYKQDRLKKVISEVEPALFFNINSRVVSRVYLYAAASVMRSVSTYERIEIFFKRLWNRIIEGTIDNNFDEYFCSNEKIFFWAHRHPKFKKLITWRSMKRLVEVGFSRVSIAHSSLKLLHDEFYKEHIARYIENDDSSIKLIERLTEPIEGCEFHVEDRFHRPLMAKLGAIIPTLMYDAIQKLTHDLDNLFNKSKTERLTKMILLWMDHCTQPDLLLDHDFISAWFGLLNEITIRQSRKDKKFEALIILFIKFICSLMECNHSQLIKILACLNYTSLGFMYNWLVNYSHGDKLVETIAHMILTYDRLDYPLEHDAVNSISDMKPNILNWMFSDNDDLHSLSIRFVERMFKDQQSSTTKILVATGLMHMIYKNPQLLAVRRHADIVKAIATEAEVIYNPLVTRLRDIMPEDIVAGINGSLATQKSPSPSPPLSFISDESDQFEEENISVMRILTQLQNDDTPEVDNSFTIPDALYVTRALVDRHINTVDMGDWERLASESNKSRVQG